MTTFPQFADLPTELQTKIWLFATENSRDIEITQYIDKSGVITKIANHIPAILHTCQNSRFIGINAYQNFSLTVQIIIYFNPLVDVIYFKSEPQFYILPPIPTRPKIHQVKLDTRWINHESPCGRIKAVQHLLSHLWRYAKFESVKLIIHEDEACYLDKDMVKAALKEAHRYNGKIDWELQPEYFGESKTRSASTNHL